MLVFVVELGSIFKQSQVCTATNPVNNTQGRQYNYKELQETDLS